MWALAWWACHALSRMNNAIAISRIDLSSAHSRASGNPGPQSQRWFCGSESPLSRGRAGEAFARNRVPNMRYLIALATAGLIVAMLWPHLRLFLPQQPRQAGAPKPASRGELIYLAILITVVLSF